MIDFLILLNKKETKFKFFNFLIFKKEEKIKQNEGVFSHFSVK